LEGLLLAAAAVIVTYNSASVIDDCLDALQNHAPELAVTVVDNGSSDGTVERVRAHRSAGCIRNQANLGFAAAVNQGVRAAGDAEFTLILNPDVTLTTSLNALKEACRTYGIAGGQLTDAHGDPQAGFTVRTLPGAKALIFELLGLNRLWPSNPVNRRYRCLDRDLEQAGPVEQPAGAFLMVRRDVWESLGGMDESFYPVWFEDVDFCRRATDAGLRIEYVPSVKGRHKGGHSVGKLDWSLRATYWCDSLLRYAAKHFSTAEYRGVCAAVLVSSVPRGLAGILRERNFEPLTVSMRIAGLAARRLMCVRQD
jgi:N-acetylglucosaminyl-diphospho-decaprenol L-rhamnosyltransferase